MAKTEAELKSETQAKVLQLTIELLETKNRKKASNAAYNEEIKRIDAEIRDLIYKPEDADDEVENEVE